MRRRRLHGEAGAVLRKAAPQGPGWVYATVWRLNYRHRLGFVRYDLALSAEDSVLVLHTAWRFVGRRRVPILELLDEGWIPRPARLAARSS